MKIKNIVLNVIIAVLCFILVVMLAVFVQQIFDYNRNYYPDETSFLYAVQEQDYPRLVDMMHRNQAAGVKTSDTYEECYAVARYYEAATYYKAYREAGNQKLASEKENIMKEQLLLMGQLSYAAEEINRKLGLQ